MIMIIVKNISYAHCFSVLSSFICFEIVYSSKNRWRYDNVKPDKPRLVKAQVVLRIKLFNSFGNFV